MWKGVSVRYVSITNSLGLCTSLRRVLWTERVAQFHVRDEKASGPSTWYPNTCKGLQNRIRRGELADLLKDNITTPNSLGIGTTGGAVALIAQSPMELRLWIR